MLTLLVLYLVVPAAQVAVFLANQWAYGPVMALDFAASITAVHWMLANAIVAAKVPVLQRLIPYDQRIRFHVLSSIGLMIAIAWHGIFKTATGAYFNAVTWALLVMVTGFFAVAILWIPVPGFRRIRSLLQRAARRTNAAAYDRSKFVHRILMLSVTTLLFLHITSAGVFATVPPASAAVYFVMFALAWSLPILSAMGAFRKRATVTAVTRHHDIVNVELEPTGRYSYRAGQFAFLRSRNANGKIEEHPFSFLSVPHEGTIRFGIRMSGDFTNHIANLQVGETVEVSRPFGNFRPRRHEQICLIGSGVGTVPIVSLLKEIAAAGEARSVLAFLAVDRREQILDHDQLAEIHRAAEGLDIRLLVYDEDGIRFSEEFFRREIPDPEHYSYYLCSSPRVRSVITDALASLGVTRSNVTFEAFSLG